MPVRQTTARARPRAPRWADWGDDALLRLRFCELGLDLRHSDVWADIERLYLELERRGLRFRPHVWLSTDWFSPDGIPGIAVPFFVAHPRLRRLERRLVGEVEGATRAERLRLLRHEAGHALDTAFALRRRGDWRGVFGPASQRYPSHYRVHPNSRSHVLHLPGWYAQSHPTEDFAETFAVWLQPRAQWRREYSGWEALAKLEYVERLTQSLGSMRPQRRDRSRIAPLGDNTRTLREHYRRRQHARPALEQRYDPWLVRAFAPRSAAKPRAKARRSAAALLQQVTTELAQRQALGLRYLTRHAGSALAARARDLGLAADASERDGRRAALELLDQVIRDVQRRNSETYSL